MRPMFVEIRREGRIEDVAEGSDAAGVQPCDIVNLMILWTITARAVVAHRRPRFRSL
jgi:hypothetical protein